MNDEQFEHFMVFVKAIETYMVVATGALFVGMASLLAIFLFLVFS